MLAAIARKATLPWVPGRTLWGRRLPFRCGACLEVTAVLLLVLFRFLWAGIVFCGGFPRPITRAAVEHRQRLSCLDYVLTSDEADLSAMHARRSIRHVLLRGKTVVLDRPLVIAACAVPQEAHARTFYRGLLLDGADGAA